jgi:hypothetical protein
MSWYSFESSINSKKVDLDKTDHCPRNQLCTLAEVCPKKSGFHRQSVVGVTAENPKKALLVKGKIFVDVATCKEIARSRLEDWTSDGVVCCRKDKLSNAKKIISKGKCCRSNFPSDPYKISAP